MLAWFTIALLPYYSQLFAKIMSWFPHRTRPVFHHQRGPALGTWHTCSKQFLFHSALSWTSSNFQSVSNIFKQFTIFYHLLPSFTIFHHVFHIFSRYLWFPVPFWTSRTRPPTAPFMWQAWQRQGPPRSGFLYLFMGYGHLSHNRDPNTMAI